MSLSLCPSLRTQHTPSSIASATYRVSRRCHSAKRARACACGRFGRWGGSSHGAGRTPFSLSLSLSLARVERVVVQAPRYANAILCFQSRIRGSISGPGPSRQNAPRRTQKRRDKQAKGGAPGRAKVERERRARVFRPSPRASSSSRPSPPSSPLSRDRRGKAPEGSRIHARELSERGGKQRCRGRS